MATVIDLEAIQARIEAQRGVCEPTRSESLQRSLPRELVVMTWQLMSSMFGHRWTSAYGDEIDPDRVWAAALVGLTEQQLRHGLKACVAAGLDWPPSAPEFRSLCAGPAASWEHRRVEAADRAWQARALPDMSRREREEAAVNQIRAGIREMLGGFS